MSSKAWGTLICIGAKDGDQRKIDLCKAEAAIGRKPGCLVLYQDTTISSTHCKLSLTVASTAGAAARPATGQLVMQVWLEDCSVNGTYVNAQKIGRGNKVRLADGDKIGLLKACGSAEPPPYAFIFRDLTVGQLPAEFPFLGVTSVPIPKTPAASGEVMTKTPRMASEERPKAPPAPGAAPLFMPKPALGLSSSRSANGSKKNVNNADEDKHGDEPYNSLHLCARSMAILSNPDAKGMRTLQGTLKRGMMDIGDFVEADGPSALLDVVSDVIAKPTLSWLDREVLDGALEALLELINSEDGAASILEAEGAFDRLVGALANPELRIRSKALQILACSVVYTDKPLVESALRRANRYGGARAGTRLVALIRGEADAQTCLDVLTLLNALVACATDPSSLLDELEQAGIDDALGGLEHLLPANPDLKRQVNAFFEAKAKHAPPDTSEDESTSTPCSASIAKAPAPAPAPTPMPLKQQNAVATPPPLVPPPLAPPPPSIAPPPPPPPLAPPPPPPPLPPSGGPPPPPPPLPGKGPPPPPGVGPPKPTGPQLRPLHWKKIATAKDGSVWKSLPPAASYDDAELRALFTIKPTVRKPSLTTPAQSAPARTSKGARALLDLKRSNQIQIAISKFRGRDMRAGVLALDEAVIKLEDIPRLRECAPTGEELEMLQPYIDEPELQNLKLAPAENFLLQMSSVPRLMPRLGCLNSKLTFAGRLQDAEAQLRAINAAVACVRSSPMLPSLLALVLKLGNELNAGTARAGAAGFSSEVLLKLAETKSTVSDEHPEQISLLHYTARAFVATTPDAQKSLRHELRPLEEAASLSTAGVTEELDGLSSELETVERELNDPVYGTTPGDCFCQKMEPWRASATLKVNALRQKVSDMLSGLESLYTYFGEVYDPTDAEALLTRVNAFAVSFCKACRDNERADHMRKKQVEAKAAAAQRAAKQGASNVIAKPKRPAAGRAMGNIQNSLRRGEFEMMKQLQSQMSAELQAKMQARRQGIFGA